MKEIDRTIAERAAAGIACAESVAASQLRSARAYRDLAASLVGASRAKYQRVARQCEAKAKASTAQADRWRAIVGEAALLGIA